MPLCNIFTYPTSPSSLASNSATKSKIPMSDYIKFAKTSPSTSKSPFATIKPLISNKKTISSKVFMHLLRYGKLYSAGRYRRNVQTCGFHQKIINADHISSLLVWRFQSWRSPQSTKYSIKNRKFFENRNKLYTFVLK